MTFAILAPQDRPMEGRLAGQRIVHVLTTIEHGGAERVVLELARRQASLGAGVRVICLQQRGALLPEFEQAGIPVSTVATDRPLGALGTAWRLAGMLKAERATVVHTHNAAPQIAAGVGQRLRRWRPARTALVHTEHGRLQDLRPSLLRWRRWISPLFDAVIAVSVDARQDLLSHGVRNKDGVEVILNGVEAARFAPPTESRKRGARIVHVGRLDHIKGQDVLIAAMPRVASEVPSVHLTIVGDGPTRAALEEQARQLGVADLVTFAGSTADVRPYLFAANLFVLPSRSEGISVALLEAMASGLPVVATDVGGNSEVVRSNAVGTLIAAEAAEELAGAIVALLVNPDAASSKGASARMEVEERFSNQRTVDEYAARYSRAREANGARAEGAVR